MLVNFVTLKPLDKRPRVCFSYAAGDVTSECSHQTFCLFLHERGCEKLHSVSSLISRFEASVVVYMSEFRDFPGGPMVRTPRFYCRVPSLVGELRSNKPPKWLNKI